MNSFKKKIFCLLWAMLVPLFLFGSDYCVENQPRVVEKAKSLPNCGILKQKENGFLFLEVSDDFVFKLLPLIRSDSFIFPPPSETHISVMSEAEIQGCPIEELGNCYYFAVRELRTVQVRGKKMWLLVVDAPDLECLRESYSLLPKFEGHDLHITIGVQLMSHEFKQKSFQRS